MSQARRLKPYAWLFLSVTAAYLPFLNQAFHIDDRIYLEVASNILSKPLFPYDYAPVFEGLISPDAASHSHLPLISYYLALVKLLSGSEKEWVYHLALLVFPLMAATGFYGLAQRYVRFPAAAAFLLFMAPGFYLLSHILMTEVPLLAFWILALSRFLKIHEGAGRRADWWICGFSLLAAGFISLLTVVLISVMAGYLVLRGTGRHSGIVFLLLLSPLLWFVWYLSSYLHYDRLVLVNTLLHMSKRGGFSWEILGQNGLSFLLHLGGVMIFPLAVWVGCAGKASLRILGLLFLLSFVPFYLWFSDWSEVQVFLFALFFSSGLLLLWEVARNLGSLRRRSGGAIYSGDASDGAQDPAPLLLWFLGVLAASLFLYYSGSVRYSVLASPAVILIWMMALERRIPETYLLKNVIWLIAILTAGYSIAISAADYQFAGVYRRSAQEIRRDYITPHEIEGVSGTPPRKLWFAGEWGFRYYLEKAGAEVLPRTATGPRAGDIIVKPYLATPWITLYDSPEYTRLLEQRQVSIKFPLRILDFGSHAGFYSTGWGILPFSISGGKPWEWFNIFEVKKNYEGAIPREERHW